MEIGLSGEDVSLTDIKRVRFSREFYLTLALVLIGAIAAGVWLRYAKAMPDDLLYIPEDAVITPEIELLQRYIRIDTSNPPGREREAAELLAAELRAASVVPEIIESAPGRSSVYARLPGRKSGEGLLLLHHIDVVPANPSHWTRPPFAGEIHQNMIWGRGALDMKSIGIAHLAAFTSLARSGQPPERDIVFLAVADEERGGALGMGWLAANRPDILEGIAYAINEGGVTETVGNEITYFGIEVGTKLSLVLQLTGERERLERIRIDLEPLADVERPERFLPGVIEYFEAIAPHRIELPELLADVPGALEKGVFWKLDPAYRALTGKTVAVGGVSDGADGGASMTAVVGFLPDEQPDEVLAWFQRQLGQETVGIRTVLAMDAAPLSSTGTPFYGKIVSAVRGEYGEVPVGPMVAVNISTDSRFLRSRGIQTYGFWPYPVDFFQTKGIHGVDERIRLDWFMRGVEMTGELVGEWAAGK